MSESGRSVADALDGAGGCLAYIPDAHRGKVLHAWITLSLSKKSWLTVFKALANTAVGKIEKAALKQAASGP